MALAKQFGDFLAEMEPCEDRDSFYVTISHLETGVSNSLGLLQDMGEFDELPKYSDEPVRISQKTLDAIQEWAEENGY